MVLTGDIDRHLARDRWPRLRTSEQAGEGQGADAPHPALPHQAAICGGGRAPASGM